jgi:hypothetical protein
LKLNVRGVKPRVRDSGTFAKSWRIWSKTPVYVAGVDPGVEPIDS